VVTKHRDVREVSLRSDVFSSAAKSIVPRHQDGYSPGKQRGKTHGEVGGV
jgi:cholest-4-en-3-one 26-monooxygenase